MTKILLVDDETPALDSMERALAPLGRQVDRAFNAREAMQLISWGEYDAIVTDLVMPGRSGMDLVGMLRNLRNRVPIVVCSGYVTDDVHNQLMMYERVGIVEKPYKPEALAAAVKRAMEEPAA